VSRTVNGWGGRRNKEVRCLYRCRLLVSGGVTSRPYAGPAAAVLEARVGSRTAPLAAAGRGAGEGGRSPEWRVPPKSPEAGRDSSGRRNVPLL
jgi:hypothetical protein